MTDKILPAIALWLRVSGTEQTTEGQLSALEAYALRRGLVVAHVYDVTASAWRGAHEKALSQVYKDARLGHFSVLLVWSLDRLSRQGARSILEIVHRLGEYGVSVLSLDHNQTMFRARFA